jgi:uncharacterized protein (DUF1697 family)
VGRYACLLRAVNVSGQRKLTMSKLREVCSALGCTEVATYLQSGNVVLASKLAKAKLGDRVTAAIAAEFGFEDVDVLVWAAEELSALVRDNPFVARGCDLSKLHVTFLSKEVKPAELKSIDAKAFLPDEFALGRKAVYVHCPAGYGRSKLNNAFFERKLGLRATTRNWRTVNSLLELASK